MESLKDEGPLKSALADPPKNTASPFILVSASVLSRKHDSLYISSFISEIIQHCRVGTPMGILPPVRGNKPVRVVYEVVANRAACMMDVFLGQTDVVLPVQILCARYRLHWRVWGRFASPLGAG